MSSVRVGDDERLRHQSGEQFEHVHRVDVVAGRDCFRGREREPAGEHAQAVEQPTLPSLSRSYDQWIAARSV